MSFPRHLSATEGRIISRLITKAISAGLSIEVEEGEEGESLCAPTQDTSMIEREIAATSITVLRLHRPTDGQLAQIGTVILIHGNEEDVVSDFRAADQEGLQLLEQLAA